MLPGPGLGPEAVTRERMYEESYTWNEVPPMAETVETLIRPKKDHAPRLMRRNITPLLKLLGNH